MIQEVELYFLELPPQRKQRLDHIHGLIMGLYPDAHITMKYKMPTYQMGDGWIALASQKHYISLYTCGYHHIEGFKARYPKIKTGKGCINLKDSDIVADDELRLVIQHAMEQSKKR